MDPDSTWQIITLLILLLLSAFFSASETALMSLSKLKVRHMVSQGIPGAKKVERLCDNPNKLLGTILVGNNLVNIASSSLATAIAINAFGLNGMTIATAVMTILILIFGEISPKTLASEHSEKFSLFVAPIILFLAIIFKPIVFITTYIGNILVKLLGGKSNGARPLITEDELKTIVDVSEEEGILEIEEKEIIKNVFEFGDLNVKDVMVQRVDVIALELHSAFEEIINVIKTEQFSRIPIYDGTIDDIVGILNVKDLLISNYTEKDCIQKFIREPIFTYEYKKTLDLFKEMNLSRQHMVIVLDEYGGTAGVITIEDILEEIVGEIEDEFDEDEVHIEKLSPNEYIVDGNMRVEDINELIDFKVESQDFDSIGGFIIDRIGAFPDLGNEILYENKRFTIEEIDKNRIKKIRINIL